MKGGGGGHGGGGHGGGGRMMVGGGYFGGGYVGGGYYGYRREGLTSFFLKQVRKPSNRQFAAPIEMPTAAPWEQVPNIVNDVIRRMNAEYDAEHAKGLGKVEEAVTGGEQAHHLQSQIPDPKSGILVAIGGEPSALLALPRRFSLYDPHHWVAQVGMHDASATAPRCVSVGLLGWSTTRDGAIYQKIRYQVFQDLLRTALSEVPPAQS
ncbi:MAG: hypothetical protein ABSG64_10840 [Solirubrobacteraceae bacterium]